MRLGVRAALADGVEVRGDVEVEDGRIARLGVSPAGAGGLAVPGFVDLQVNGFAGVDFLTAEPDDYASAGAALAAAGVTAFQPTLISAPPESLRAALAHGAAAAERSPIRLLGFHLEGPFLSPARRGAHPLEHLRDPDPALAEELLAAGARGRDHAGAGAAGRARARRVARRAAACRCGSGTPTRAR